MPRATLRMTLAACLVAAAGPAFAGGLDLRIGAFSPRGHETLFKDLNDLYTPNADPDHGVTARDFRGVFGGIEYNTVVHPNVELAVHLDGYDKTVDSSYRQYYSQDTGGEIRQRLRLAIVPLGMTVRLVPTRKAAHLAPYVGGGIDAVFYEYKERGDFVDTFDANLTIRADEFKDNGAAFGAHVVGGLRVYVNHDFAIVAEGRYQWAKATMGGNFSQEATGFVNTIDLGGASAVVGLHLRF